MLPPAFQIAALRAAVDEEALLQRRVRLRVQRCILRASEAAVRYLIPPTAPIRVEKLSPFGLLLRADLPITSVTAEVRLSVSVSGRLAAELAAVQTDLLGIPVSLVAAFLREFLPKQPWLHQAPGTRWEIDLAELVRPYGIALPPLTGVRGGPGLLELEFAGEPADVPAAEPFVQPGRPAEPASTATPSAPSAAPEPFDAAAFVAALPESLKIGAAPAPGQPPVRLSIPFRNPSSASVWLELRPQPFWVRVEPASFLLPPHGVKSAAVEIDQGQVTAQNHRSAQVTVVWTAPEGSGGAIVQRRGERVIPIEIPPPRRLFLCPNPQCEQILHSGDAACPHCGTALRYCPECGSPALAEAKVCSGKGRHPLP